MKPHREFAVNEKQNSANYNLKKGDRLKPKHGGGERVGIMRIFNQGPCTRAMQYKERATQ